MSFFAPPEDEPITRAKPPLCRSPRASDGIKCQLYRDHYGPHKGGRNLYESWD